MEEFEPKPQSIEKLIRSEKKGDVLVPDFQRKFVWKVDEEQKSLLYSILAGLPIGSFLFMEGDVTKYGSRMLCFEEEATLPENQGCQYLLDGQQRLSTIKSIFFDLLAEERLGSKSKEDVFGLIPDDLQNRWWLRIFKTEDSDRWGLNNLSFQEEDEEIFRPGSWEEYVFVEKKLSLEKYSRSDKAIVSMGCDEDAIPLWLVFDKWPVILEILGHIANKRDIELDEEEKKRQIDAWAYNINTFLRHRLEGNRLPTILIPRNRMEAGLAVFEQSNRQGVTLDAYDLVVARAARIDNFKLAKEVEKAIKEESVEVLEGFDEDTSSDWEQGNMSLWYKGKKMPTKAFRKMFKNCLAIAATLSKKGELHKGCEKEATLLDLTADEIKQNYRKTLDSLFHTLQFFQFRCGCKTIQDIHYDLISIPVFTHFISLEQDADSVRMLNLLEAWYWASLFSGEYRTTPAAHAMEDSRLILRRNEKEFEDKIKEMREKIFDATEYSDRNSLLKNTGDGKAAMKAGIIQFVLAQGARCRLSRGGEFVNLTAQGEARGDFRLDKHHIIPLKKVKKQATDTEKELIWSPLNFTKITRSINGSINAVEDYNDKEIWDASQFNDFYMPNPLDKTKYPDDWSGNTEQLKLYLADRYGQLKKGVEKRISEMLGEDG